MKIPCKGAKYIHVYDPQPDVFDGPDTNRFRAGERYDKWVPNDFSIIYDGVCWHLFGITHPCPPEFIDSDSRFDDVHEGEWQLFHAISTGSTLKESLKPGGFRQVDQVLTAAKRPDERKDIWAPIIWKRNDTYTMIYSPNPFRRAVSDNLLHWTPKGTLFHTDDQSARDPNIMEKDGIYHLVYLKGNDLYARESRDLCCFGDERLIFTGRAHVSLESPILKYIDGCYYLLYCVYDGRDQVNGYYDNRTYVHAAPTLDALNGSPCVATFDAHAPELFQDEDGDWYLASAEWPHRGISIMPIHWV